MTGQLQNGGDVGSLSFDFLPLQIVLPSSGQTGSAQFLSLIAAGADVTNVRLIGVDETRVGVPKTFELQLSNAFVTGFSTTSDGILLSIEAPVINLQTWTPDADDKLFATPNWTYAESGATSTPPASGGTQPAVPAVKYFMAVSGLNGGSTDANHLGWFALDDFDVGALSALLEGGGELLTTGVAEPVFRSLGVSLRNDTGLTSFLALAASGGPISSIRIEGVNQTGVATYKLDLGNVTVTELTDPGDAGFLLGLGYQKIGVTTIPPGGVATSTLYDVGADVLGGTPIPVATPGPGVGTTAKAQKFFATFSGIKGDSTDAGHLGWFQVEAPAIRMDRDYDPAAMTAGAARFSDIDLFFRSETAFTAFFGAATAGTVLAGVTVRGTDFQGRVVYNLYLSNARITSFQDFGDGMQVSLSHDEFDLMTQQRFGSGIPPVNTVVGWDTVNEVAVTDVGSLNPNHATADAKVAPQRYFMVLDGVNGGSRNADYRNWFELDLVNFGATQGQQSLTVVTLQQMGYSALLQDYVTNEVLASARIEGVATVGGVLRPVTRIDLGNVSVSRLTDDSNLGFSFQLDFDKIITRTLNATTGAVTGISGWDNVAGAPTTGAIATPTPGATPPTVATGLRYFIKMDGVGGDATASGHVNWIEVDYSSDFGAGPEGGNPDRGVMQLGMGSLGSMTQLLGQLTGGNDITAVLETVDELGRVVTVMEMGGVYVTDLSANLEGSLGVTLAYEAFELTTNRFNAANAVTGFDRFGHSIANGSATTVTPTAVATAAQRVAPNQFFMAFDGVHGGLRTADRGGWFAINSVEFGASNSVDSTVGASEPVFDTVSLYVQSQAGLSALMAKLASGAVTGGVAIEGVVTTGGIQRTVLDLSLGNVLIRDIQVDPQGGFVLKLEFAQMSLDTWANVPVGGNNGLLQTRWNLETGTDFLPGPINAAPGGTAAKDVLSGSAQADLMNGQNGNDAMYGLDGNDTLNGGNGADTLVGGAGSDVLNGGSGAGDYASYAGAAGGVTVSLSILTSQNTVNAGQDRLSGIEGLLGSGHADSLTGDGQANVIYGAAGGDTIAGLGGADVLYGEAGHDVLIGGAGSDTITGGAGNDSFVFNAPGDNVDLILDFDSSATPGDTDVLRLAGAGFGGLASGVIQAAQFQSSLLPNALTPDVRFIYASSSAGLFYDADGNGAAFSPILLAQIITPIVAGDIHIF